MILDVENNVMRAAIKVLDDARITGPINKESFIAFRERLTDHLAQVKAQFSKLKEEMLTRTGAGGEDFQNLQSFFTRLVNKIEISTTLEDLTATRRRKDNTGVVAPHELSSMVPNHGLNNLLNVFGTKRLANAIRQLELTSAHFDDVRIWDKVFVWDIFKSSYVVPDKNGSQKNRYRGTTLVGAYISSGVNDEPVIIELTLFKSDRKVSKGQIKEFNGPPPASFEVSITAYKFFQASDTLVNFELYRAGYVWGQATNDGHLWRNIEGKPSATYGFTPALLGRLYQSEVSSNYDPIRWGYAWSPTSFAFLRGGAAFDTLFEAYASPSLGDNEVRSRMHQDLETLVSSGDLETLAKMYALGASSEVGCLFLLNSSVLATTVPMGSRRRG